MSNDLDNQEYKEWLVALKVEIGTAQTTAVIAVNQELLKLYWNLGKQIVQKQQSSGWGSDFLRRLSSDLQHSFPEMKGFSRTNLAYIRQWYVYWSAMDEKIPQLVGQIPWGHNRLIISKFEDKQAALFYVEKTIENGWSRAVLAHQIELQLHLRTSRSINNFELTLPPQQSELAKEHLKDPYIFDFLELGEEAKERDIEQGLIEHISHFLMELGSGFAYVGRQYHLEVNGDDFYIDLLFFHIPLNCYVVIELKAKSFNPKDTGQLNFYMAAIDGEIKNAEHNPTIGILLCKEKNELVVEYALRNIDAPIGVSQYELTKSLPDKYLGKLPTIEDLELELIDDSEANKPST